MDPDPSGTLEDQTFDWEVEDYNLDPEAVDVLDADLADLEEVNEETMDAEPPPPVSGKGKRRRQESPEAEGAEAVAEEPVGKKRRLEIMEAQLMHLLALSKKADAEKARAKKVLPLKLNPPTPFNGKRGSFEFFASKIRSYAQLTQVPNSKLVALAVQQLEEKPTKVWESHKKKLERDGIAITWNVFFKFMLSRYDSSDLVAQARAKLDKVYQGNEGVERYIERYMSLLADVETEYEMCEQDKIHLFLKGLDTPLKLACTVNPATGKSFEDLDTLCTYVVRYETSLKAVGGARGQTGAGPRTQRLAQFKNGPPPYVAPIYGPPTPPGYFAGAVQPPPPKVDSRTAVPPDRQCYFCRELGHEAWQCQKKKEYLAKRAKQHRHAPVHYQPGYYPYGVHPPVAAPAVPWAGYPWGPPGVGKSGRRGKNGKGNGKNGKGKGALPGKSG